MDFLTSTQSHILFNIYFLGMLPAGFLAAVTLKDYADRTEKWICRPMSHFLCIVFGWDIPNWTLTILRLRNRTETTVLKVFVYGFLTIVFWPIRFIWTVSAFILETIAALLEFGIGLVHLAQTYLIR